MKRPVMYLVSILLLLPLAAVAMGAAGQEAQKDDVKSLNEKVRQLQSQLDEQQKKHDREIEELRRRIEELSQEKRAGETPAPPGGSAEAEMEKLRRAARASATEEPAQTAEGAGKVFKSGGLGLQALNPELSVTGDSFFAYSSGHGVTQHQGFTFRNLSLHFNAYLDPYTRFKAAVPINDDTAKIGEAYFTRFGVLDGWNLTVGKFRQQFGVVNRWHKHALDWVDFPMPLREIFGGGGLDQTGVAMDWSGTLGDASQELTIQVTNGENARVFGENLKNRPSVLAHYKVNKDLSPSTYIEAGATAMAGWNDTWQTTTGPVEQTKSTQLYGVDCSLLWEPTDRMRYRNVELRTEGYFLNKGILPPDGSGGDTLRPWGAYTSLQTKVSRTVDVGCRLDYYQPDVKAYADTLGLSLSPLAVTKSGAYQTTTALYVTWWQSPFVKFRTEYDYTDSKGLDGPLHQVFLQCVFAAGPHKHERY